MHLLTNLSVSTAPSYFLCTFFSCALFIKKSIVWKKIYLAPNVSDAEVTILTAHFLPAVVRIEPGALCMVGKCPVAELCPSPLCVSPFWDRDSLSCPVWPWTGSVTQAGIGFLILLHQLSWSWDSRPELAGLSPYVPFDYTCCCFSQM